MEVYGKNENFAKNTEFLKQMQNVIEKVVKIHQKRLKFLERKTPFRRGIYPRAQLMD